MTIGRPVDGRQLVEALGVLAAMEVRNLALRAIVDRREEVSRTALGVAFWVEDGLLEIYALDDEIEAATGIGGTLLAEVTVGTALGRCLVCGRGNRQQTPWCGKRCRVLFRGDADARFPSLDRASALACGIEWATCERNTRLGWHVPLTRQIAERLYHHR